MARMLKKKDGDPKKALMAKPSSATAPKMLKSGTKGAIPEGASIIGKKYPTPKTKSIPFPVKVKSYNMKTGMKNK